MKKRLERLTNAITIKKLTSNFDLTQPNVAAGIYDEVDRDGNLTARFAGWGAVEVTIY